MKYKTSFNIIPSTYIPVKTIEGAKLMKWIFAPPWKPNMKLINCRSETMNVKPSFKHAERCVIYNNGWYEWQNIKNQKTPYYHYSESNVFAGLYNEIGCLILTRQSTNKISHIHHRQPVLLNDFEIEYYLKGANLLNSDANYNIFFHQVGKNVNNPKNDTPNLINKIIF